MSTSERPVRTTIASTVSLSTASISLTHGLENTEGLAINLAIWISLVTMSVVVFAKVASSLSKIQQGVHIKDLQLDDVSVLAAMVKKA